LTTLLVPVGIVGPLHEVKPLLVLALDLELEPELVEHLLNLCGGVRSIGLDQFFGRSTPSGDSLTGDDGLTDRDYCTALL